MSNSKNTLSKDNNGLIAITLSVIFLTFVAAASLAITSTYIGRLRTTTQAIESIQLYNYAIEFQTLADSTLKAGGVITAFYTSGGVGDCNPISWNNNPLYPEYVWCIDDTSDPAEIVVKSSNPKKSNTVRLTMTQSASIIPCAGSHASLLDIDFASAVEGGVGDRELHNMTVQNTGIACTITIDKIEIAWGSFGTTLLEEVVINSTPVWGYMGPGAPAGKQISSDGFGSNVLNVVDVIIPAGPVLPIDKLQFDMPVPCDESFFLGFTMGDGTQKATPLPFTLSCSPPSTPFWFAYYPDQNVSFPPRDCLAAEFEGEACTLGTSECITSITNYNSALQKLRCEEPGNTLHIRNKKFTDSFSAENPPDVDYVPYDGFTSNFCSGPSVPPSADCIIGEKVELLDSVCFITNPQAHVECLPSKTCPDARPVHINAGYTGSNDFFAELCCSGLITDRSIISKLLSSIPSNCEIYPPG